MSACSGDEGYTPIIHPTGEWRDATYARDDLVLNSPDWWFNIIVLLSTFLELVIFVRVTGEMDLSYSLLPTISQKNG